MIPAPLVTTRVSGYDFGAPLPVGGWTGTGQSFGWNRHLGVDIGTPAGSPIIAPFDAVAKFEQGLVGYGNRLTLTLANGWKFIFGHVAQGANGTVRAGQRVGTTGRNIGSARGAVTLVEVHDPGGQAVNPHRFLDPIASGRATLTSLFGPADAQVLSQSSPPAATGGPSGASGGPSVPVPNFGAAWNTLIKDLQAFPTESSRNTAAQVGAIQTATNQLTSSFKPFNDFFGRVGDLIQPKHLWTGFFVTLGGVMVVVGLVMYFKGDEIVQTVKTVTKDAGEAAAVAA